MRAKVTCEHAGQCVGNLLPVLGAVRAPPRPALQRLSSTPAASPVGTQEGAVIVQSNRAKKKLLSRRIYSKAVGCNAWYHPWPATASVDPRIGQQWGWGRQEGGTVTVGDTEREEDWGQAHGMGMSGRISPWTCCPTFPKRCRGTESYYSLGRGKGEVSHLLDMKDRSIFARG